jgi:hypothetical protein
MEKNYRISFRNGDISFDLESADVKWLEKKEKIYLQKITGRSIDTTVDDQILSDRPVKAETGSRITLNEFYRKHVHKIKSRPTVAVFLLYYLEKIKKKDKIRTVDIISCFKDIGYPNWNKLNVTDIMTSAKRRALVNYWNKFWSLTTTGEDFVLNMLSGKSK